MITRIKRIYSLFAVYNIKEILMKLFNIMIPEAWIGQLKKIARTESVKRDDNVSVSRLIREALEERYELKGQ